MSEEATAPEEPKTKRGRPPWAPSEHDLGQIKAHAANGVPQKVICRVLGRHAAAISENEAAQQAYEAGKSTALVLLAGTAYRTALGIDKHGKQSLRPEIRLLEYLCKTQLGWTETNRVEHTGANGGPIKHQDMTEEQVVDRIVELLSDPATDGETAH